MFLLTLRDLQFRKRRLLVVTLLAAVVFTLLFLMTGLVEQFNREPFETVTAVDAPNWLIAEGASSPFTAASTLPADIGQEITGVTTPGVVGRATLSGAVAPDGQQVILMGAPADAAVQPALASGRQIADGGDVVVDVSLGAQLGERVEIGGYQFEVVGLSDRTTLFAGIPLAFVELEPAQDIVFGTTDAISALYVDGGRTPEGAVVRSSRAIAADALTPLDGAIGSLDLIRALLWVVAAVVIGAVVYLSALERQRDFAVLKAIGAGNRDLVVGLAAQAVLIALLAVGAAMLLQALIQPVFPLRVQVPPRAFWQVPVFAVVVGLLSAAAGLRRVARTDPAHAFSGGGA